VDVPANAVCVRLGVLDELPATSEASNSRYPEGTADEVVPGPRIASIEPD